MKEIKLTEAQLDRLEEIIDYPIKRLRKFASADEIKPQGIMERWTKGRCVVEIIDNGWL